MSVNNAPAKQNNNAQGKKPKFSIAIKTSAYQNLINQTLGDPKRAQRFVTSISSAVAVNPTLQECDAGTILSGALLGESLMLSPSPQLGHYYLVPFNNKKMGCKEAQFVLGYKGYVQLAMRSGQYKHINCMAIKAGELKKYDPFNDIFEAEYIEDEAIRDAAPTIGYYAMFEYLNGFKKVLYWSRDKMLRHADKYSQAFSIESKETTDRYGNPAVKVSYEDYIAGNYDKKTEWLYSSFWYKDFDTMACKTLIRQLISKWGIMSIEMMSAFDGDNSVINEDLTPKYHGIIDSEPEPPEQQSLPEVQAEPVVYHNMQKEEGAPKVSATRVSLDDF